MSFVCTGEPAFEAGSETIPGMRKPSFWNRKRLATRSRLKGIAESWLSRMGFMKRGQRRREMERKDIMSRPECLERES